ncbi:hypothetical protein VHUM_03136 [Vanrija humicola]|uniref:Uncharacterized protein n=1 Tax=Vanrija humicola TaxID=5417 RepID=A0A7D8UY49_VANHU|nr:hypothetical protein VHUM_03136 [Vanrija humicola]
MTMSASTLVHTVQNDMYAKTT